MYTKPFLLLALVSFLTFGILNAYNLLPLYIHALEGREAEIGRIMALYQIAAILCQATTAGLLDRWSRRPVLIAGRAALTVASLAFALTTRLSWQFYGIRVGDRGAGVPAELRAGKGGARAGHDDLLVEFTDRETAS